MGSDSFSGADLLKRAENLSYDEIIITRQTLQFSKWHSQKD